MGMLRRSDMRLLHAATGLYAGAGASDAGRTNGPSRPSVSRFFERPLGQRGRKLRFDKE